ncbi:hypothetical protein FP744_10005887 [Trichoderma asperellum]|nr:hypothetical protein LI328DRAFT_168122 [Trichoderma asperelloides]
MAFYQNEPSGQAETADEYARREDCFRNHRQHPFTFQSHISDLLGTKEATERDGLVSQPGLKAGVLPNPQIAEHVLDQHQRHQKNAERLLHDSPPRFPLLSANSYIRELLIPVDDLALGFYLQNDYLRPIWAKRYGNPFKQWLPLARTRVERDESLEFPPVLDGLLAQIHREIETDKPIISDIAADLVRKANKSITTSEYQDLVKRRTTFEPCQYSYVEPILPPLSPISDDATPFIPDRNVTVIDLVSDPSSPIQAAIEDSEPIVSSTFMTSSPTRELPQLFQTSNAVIEDKVDLPVVLSSSYSPSRENILTNICLPLIDLEEDASGLLQERGYFEDAFMTLLDDRQYYANKLVSQERLDPPDSTSRIPVPLLDFNIPPPTWIAQLSTAETHFAFLRKSVPSIFNIVPSPRDLQLELDVSYLVIPPNQGRSIMRYEHDISNETATKYLSHNVTSHLSSFDFVTMKPELEVLCIAEDKEIEEVYMSEEAYLLDTVIDKTLPVIVVEQHESPNRVKSLQESKSVYIRKLDSPELSRSIRRKADDSMRILPKCYDTSATSILLHNFMELRGIKRPRIETTASEACQPADSLPSESMNEAYSTDTAKHMPTTTPEAMAPAIFPKFEVPSAMVYFIVSVDLPRPILRRLEHTWSPESLVDIDYSQHIAIPRPSSSAQCEETTLGLSFEADISLSPLIGIIITNILKVRQRPLPGSQAQTMLRERVQKVSQKYETLLVLVSESHPSGEFSGASAPSDITAYADFVSFTVALDGDISVQLVPGAEQTMASWVSAFVSQNSYKSHDMKRLLSPEETLWEIFLRRAGMNVFAAKILSKTLFEKAGASGLAAFLMMPVEERVARFAPLLGGEKVLRLTAKALDRRWGQ